MSNARVNLNLVHSRRDVGRFKQLLELLDAKVGNT